ncbi:MAG: hypothetical protein HC819_05680 [Cyclobacteriaceae bacterium]|nr:hypothetical protein [Cyclobacteriaceae bacterium]
MTAIDSFEKITLNYHSGSIPPPFAHQYSIEIARNEQGGLHAVLQLEYTDRDELAEEEIFEEGFSNEDDYSWEGELPAIWGKEIVQKLKMSTWKKKPGNKNDDSFFEIKIAHGFKTELLYPDKPKVWEILAQEIIQAVFELGKKEAPLQIAFLNGDTTGKAVTTAFTFYFANQSIEIKQLETEKKKSMDWAGGQRLLKYIFNVDYDPEKGEEKQPVKAGHYIAPGDGLWYELAPHENAGKVAREQMEKLVASLKDLSKFDKLES